MSEMIRKVYAARFTKAEDRVYDTTLSTSEGDREHDRLDVTKWVIPRRVPLLWAHDALRLPIGKVTEIHPAGKALKGRIQFPPVGASSFADEVVRLVDADIIASTSVGFRALAKPRPNELGGLDFSGQDLCELSLVNVPANVSAAIEGRAGEEALLLKWYETRGDEAVVLDLDDGEDTVVDLADLQSAEFLALFAAAVRDTVREALAPAVRQAVRQSLGGARSEPFMDPATVHRQADVVDVTPAQVRAALASQLPALLREQVGQQVAEALRHARGRVD